MNNFTSRLFNKNTTTEAGEADGSTATTGTQTIQLKPNTYETKRFGG